MVPAIVGALVLLTYSLRLLSPYRPQWTKPFLRETKAESDELDEAPRHRFAWSTYGLLAISSIGLILQLSSTLSDVPLKVTAASSSPFSALAWVSSQSAIYMNHY